MNQKPYVIKGGVHEDKRGKLSFINGLDLKDIRRFYIISHPDQNIVRAWQGHRSETKYFVCISGAFEIRLVEVDDWTEPSNNLPLFKYQLREQDMEALVVPPGYANGFKAFIPDSSLLVFSDKPLEESRRDDYRFDKNLWCNWN